jgi:hypothetical protein
MKSQDNSEDSFKLELMRARTELALPLIDHVDS